MRELFDVQLLADHGSCNMRGSLVLNSLPSFSACVVEVCIQDRFILRTRDYTGEKTCSIYMIKIKKLSQSLP